MKRILMSLLLMYCILGSHAQDNFTLSMELVKPSGKIDSKSYFLARLKNHNDSLSFLVYYGGNFLRSYFKVIYDKIGESETSSYGKQFFDFGDKKCGFIDPTSELQVKLPLFIAVNGIDDTGILPLSSKALRKVRRIRIKLEKFEFLPVMRGSYDPKHFYPKKMIDLYSNWLTVNGENFIPVLTKYIRPDD